MSRWIKSVGTLLDNLDGQAENLVDDADNQELPTSRGAVGQVLSSRGLDYDDDDEEYESWDEGEEEYESYDDDEEEEIDLQQPESPLAGAISEPLFQDDEAVEETAPASSPVPSASETLSPVSAPEALSPQVATTTGSPKSPEPAALPAVPASPRTQRDEPASATTPKTDVSEEPITPQITSPRSPLIKDANAPQQTPPRPPPPPKQKVQSPPKSEPSITAAATPPSSANFSTNVAQLHEQLKRAKQDAKKAQAESRQLRKHVMSLNSGLEAAELEVTAQRQELERAAKRMERERQLATEAQEDLEDDHEDELEKLKEHYEALLQEQTERHQEQTHDLQERLDHVEERHLQEGGDWTKELEDSIQRERETLKQLNQTKDEAAALKSRLSKVETQQAALQSKLETTTSSLQAATERERQTEDRYDAAMSLHSRQMSQRQNREAELERTIADLGAALVAARQEKKFNTAVATAPKPRDSVNYKEQFELTVEELETVKAQLTMANQQCEAMRQELNEISTERAQEAALAQSRQRQHDGELADLKATISKLQSSLGEQKEPSSSLATLDGNASSRELEDARRQVKSLSEQVLKLQGQLQQSKTEILALKGRVQTEKNRADAAEQAQEMAASSSTNAYGYDSGGGVARGGASMRRRYKGGRTSRGTTSVRSIRSALEIGPGQMEHVAGTLDAVDHFMVDTGSFMRQEPLARLAFLLYLCVLHLWSFCLVIFHAHSYEEVHGDLGNLSEAGGGIATHAMLRKAIPEQP